MTQESMEFERLRRQAVEIGERRLTGRWEELLAMLSSAAPRVRRAAASALGKLAEADRSLHPAFVAPLFLRAMDETGDQVREYLFKALARCSSAMSAEMVKGVRDVVRNPTLKAYVRAAANEALSAGERAVRGRAIALRRECVRCHARISPEESEVAMMRYGKPYCRHCLDERMLEDVHFEKDVTAAKRLRTTDHIAVQSRGEKRIGDWLAQQGMPS